MSRGPGSIQRAIEVSFRSHPSRVFSTDDLAALAYPGINRIDKKHRVAVLRAADAVGRRLFWQGARSEAPAGPIVYYNLCDVRSYALGRMRIDFTNNDLSLTQIETLLDDPHCHRSRWSWTQPGGAWHKHVEINCLYRDGQHDEAESVRTAHNAGVRGSLGC